MIKAGVLTPSMMSKKQRRGIILNELHLPKYLWDEVMKNDTDAKRELNRVAYGMIIGKIEFDVERLVKVKDEVMKGK